MIDDKDIPKQRDLELPTPEETMEKIKQQIKQTQLKEKRIMPNNKGVKESKEFFQLIGAGYDAIYEARSGDGKIDFPEDYIAIGAKVGGKVIPAFNGVSDLDDELIYDEVTPEEQEELASVFDECKHLKGDTRQASKEMLGILNQINNWRLKYFGKLQKPEVI